MGSEVARGVYAVGSGTSWDDSRNTSRRRPPPPGAHREAIAACRELAEREPALVEWIRDGAPTLTEAEHRRRFGRDYERAGGSRPAKGQA